MYQPLLPMEFTRPALSREQKGVVFTKPWVVEVLLDLAGYTEQANLVDSLAIEPAAGEGAFLVPMAERLVASCRKQKRPLDDCVLALIAYEVNEASADLARHAVMDALKKCEVPSVLSQRLASSWVRTGDYLFDAPRLGSAAFVVGNPPYIRLEEIPLETANLYRNAYPSMRGRADLYVAFFEAGLRQLDRQGVCAFLCADRWMLNQYGSELRRLITESYGVEMIVEMHDASPFEDEVDAYPALTVIRRCRQSRTVVARAGLDAEKAPSGLLALALRAAADGRRSPEVAGLSTAVVETWFTGSDPWPCRFPGRLALLRRIEEQFEPLESEATGTRVGIGVATGLDKVFITRDAGLVEPSRLLPLAMAQDTVTGYFQWAGHYLVNPWDAAGLVRLQEFPRLQTYLEKHHDLIKKRNTAQKNPQGWYRTIDRVAVSLTSQPKLLIPDIKDRFNPVLDRGEAYPHHNLYFVTSDRWDLEILGGLLLSAISQLFIESYGVRMRGGYLRFQAQYLRRVRVPSPDAISPDQAQGLVQAFRQRNRELATKLASEIYRIQASEIKSVD